VYKDLQGLRNSADKRTPHKSARLSFVEKSLKQRGWEPPAPAGTILEVRRGCAGNVLGAPPGIREINLFSMIYKDLQGITWI